MRKSSQDKAEARLEEADSRLAQIQEDCFESLKQVTTTAKISVTILTIFSSLGCSGSSSVCPAGQGHLRSSRSHPHSVSQGDLRPPARHLERTLKGGAHDLPQDEPLPGHHPDRHQGVQQQEAGPPRKSNEGQEGGGGRRLRPQLYEGGQ